MADNEQKLYEKLRELTCEIYQQEEKIDLMKKELNDISLNLRLEKKEKIRFPEEYADFFCDGDVLESLPAQYLHEISPKTIYEYSQNRNLDDYEKRKILILYAKKLIKNLSLE